MPGRIIRPGARAIQRGGEGIYLPGTSRLGDADASLGGASNSVYVDAITPGSDSNPGTLASPWATVAHAASAAPTKTVYVRYPDLTWHALAAPWVNLFALYPMVQGASATTVYDVANGRHGTITGLATWSAEGLIFPTGAYASVSSGISSGAMTYIESTKADWTVPTGQVANIASPGGATPGSATSGMSISWQAAGVLDWLANERLSSGDGYNSGRAPRAIGSLGTRTFNEWVWTASRLGASGNSSWVNGVADTRVAAALALPTFTSFTINDNSSIPNTKAWVEIHNALLSDAELS